MYLSHLLHIPNPTKNYNVSTRAPNQLKLTVFETRDAIMLARTFVFGYLCVVRDMW